MLYHVIRRPPHSHTNSSNRSQSNQKPKSILNLMPRYHYSRIAPQSASTSSESFFHRQNSNRQSSKPITTITTTSNNNNNNNNNNQYSSAVFKSTFIPLVTNSRLMTPNKREFIQIPVTKADGEMATNHTHTVPVTFMGDKSALSSTGADNSRTTTSKLSYTGFLRPSSKHSQHHATNTGEEFETSVPRLPSVSRRFNLTTPLLTTTTTTTALSATTSTSTPATVATDDDTTVQNASSPSIRHIPIRFSQPSNIASIPTNSTRISSAILRSSPFMNSSNNQLHRQKTDVTTDTTLSDHSTTVSNVSPVRRAEIMAREAIQGIVRFQQQQPTNSINDHNNNNATNNNISIRSPGLLRRVIVNLKNNQSVSLDSRLSSANVSSAKPPSSLSSARTAQRNNLYHIPVLHEIQMPSHPATAIAETTLHLSSSPSTNRNNNHNYKNELRMEIPVAFITRSDQENHHMQLNSEQEDLIMNYEQPMVTVTERIPSTNMNSNQTLKSILKRSSSRETVSRKNVSFMNA